MEDSFVRLGDKKRYVLEKKGDYQILKRIYQLEKKKLSAVDKQVVKLIRTQLRHDWRMPLLRELNRLLRKYKK